MHEHPRVLISERLDDACAAWLAERCTVIRHRYDAPGFNDALAKADGLVVRTYTRVGTDLLRRAPSLRVVGRAGVGLDNFDLAACRAAGVRVVYTPDANTQAVVEYVLGLMLDRFRPRSPLPPAADADTFHAMRSSEVGTELATLTLGVVGYGRIGKRLTAAAEALGMRVLCCDIDPDAAPGSEPHRLVPHEQVYAEADVLTLHADGRPENRHLVDAAVLRRLKPTALLINAARGPLVDAQALTHWLTRHPQAHAVLDVHDPEPPPPNHPLHALPNCRLQAHLASRTHTALSNMSRVVEDVAAVLQNQEPRFPAFKPSRT